MNTQRFLFTAALAASGLGLTATASADLGSAIQDGADRLVETQYTDGLWGFPLTAPPTYLNVTGPIGQGLINAYGQTNDVDHINAAKLAGDAIVGETSDWVGTYNPEFLVDLADATLTSDPTASAGYLGQATSFYTELTAGTYTRNGNDYDTNEWISLVETARSGSNINLRPWEFAPQAIAADRVGTITQQTAFVQATKDGIDTLTNAQDADVLGLAGGIRGLARLNENHDPTTGAFASAGSLSDLANLLAGLQNVNGSWNINSAIATPTGADEDLQTTAFAMLALFALNDTGQYDDEILLGRDYLIDAQLTNGGWPVSGSAVDPGGTENAEVDGEIVWALSATTAVPEPASLALLSAGGLLMLRRRRNAV